MLKRKKLIICGVFSVILISLAVSIFLFYPRNTRDCPLIDINLGTPYEEAIRVLDKKKIVYEAMEHDYKHIFIKNIMLKDISGMIELRTDKEKKNISLMGFIVEATSEQEFSDYTTEMVKYLTDLYGAPKQYLDLGTKDFYTYITDDLSVSIMYPKEHDYDYKSFIQISWNKVVR
ncbi:hypothetical protein GPL15_20385 [Clostridium sp. MCC353]|uniref:hypothetical protein n=1 Tax=Clostridium sp. MCC353 TaxID=2592646 RepID=UPI001C0106F9|nr:hypothetical protein [Clostridium sp. MCC353]MBT9778841.1 hypothetical protein [Clostridium sp. MCC353]